VNAHDANEPPNPFGLSPSKPREARSLLFVPGNRPERFEKALRSGADAVILDLEDAVPLSDKPAARAALRARWTHLLASNVPLLVRINAAEGGVSPEDLDALEGLSGLAAVMVPKADSPRALRHVREVLEGVPLLPIIETAAGYEALKSIVAQPGVLRLALGHIDFMADTGITCDAQQSELAPLRFAIAMTTRGAGLGPAIDGVTVETNDDERLRDDTQRALRFGFGGKLCIHPRQVRVVHDAMAPSAEELDWARRVIEADAASGGAAVQLDGRMVDLPVVLQARRTLARLRDSRAR
jgi:citrate lyase subunit beta/citryl-CoA lyase